VGSHQRDRYEVEVLMITVWQFITGELFTIEDKGDGYLVSMGDNLMPLFEKNKELFVEYSKCLGEL